jgi:predicted P-loop ATPase/GTPase
VAVVEPRRLRLYDGGRYLKACEVAPRGRSDGTLEQRVDTVVDLLDPVETVRLDPLSPSVLADPAAVADAYEDTFDRVLSVARQASSPV